MALTDQPYLPFYVNEWLSNKKLKFCSPAAHGIMINIMALMHKEDVYGTILLNQTFKQSDNQIENFALQLSKLTAFDSREIIEPLAELITIEVLVLDGDLLICNRMVCDAEISLVRASVGQEGGRATQRKNKLAKAKLQANVQANTVIETVIVNEVDSSIVLEEKEGVGEKEDLPPTPTLPKPIGEKDPIVVGMMQIFKKHQPDYPELDSDRTSCRLLAHKIVEKNKWAKNSFEREKKRETLEFWEKIIEWKVTDNFFSTKQLSNIVSQWGNFLASYEKSLQPEKLNRNGKYRENTSVGMGRHFVSTPI